MDCGKKIGDSITTYWRDCRIEWSGGEPIYVGKSPEHSKATDEEGWKVWKWTWTSGEPTRRQGPVHGKWDDRATAGWWS